VEIADAISRNLAPSNRVPRVVDQVESQQFEGLGMRQRSPSAGGGNAVQFGALLLYTGEGLQVLVLGTLFT